MKEQARPGGVVQSVARSLDLLEALAVPGEHWLVEVAQRTGLQPSTVHRLLATLVSRGYVLQSVESGRYMLGYKLLELAGQVSERPSHLRAIARPHLAAVQQATGETVNLAVLELPDVVYVEQVEGTRSVRMFAQVGRRVPAHATAVGKVMLSFQKSEVVAAVYGARPLEPYTHRTVATPDALSRELARIRCRGYATDDEEYEDGVRCVAAPIFDHTGAVCAALSVSGPSGRIATRDWSRDDRAAAIR